MKHFSLFLLFAVLLSSCAPAFPTQATLVPTQTAIPSTNTPLPPTTTLTPAPENLADAKDLPVWVENYVNAYSGKVTVDGVEVDATQLLNEIKTNSDSFTQVKQVNGAEYSFLVVNNAPLALRSEITAHWEEATIAKVSGVAKITTGMTAAINLTEEWSPDHEIVSQVIEKSGGTLKLDYDLMWWLPVQNEQPDSLRPSLSVINYKNIDKATRYAQRHNLGLVAPLLVQNPYFLPDWLKEITDKSQLKDVATNHIQSLVSKYPQIAEWTVMSEFENPYFSNLWTKTFGLSDVSWIVDFYNTAHSSNPNAVLAYSDFDIEFGGGKADRVFELVKEIKAAGAPLDIIAFQMHLNGKDFIDPAIRTEKMQELAGQIKRYQDIGMQVEVGEMDLAMHDTPLELNQRAEIQAEIMKAIMDTVLDNGIKRIFFFGINDKYSWKNFPENGGGAGAIATPFGENGELKPAYYAIVQSIYEHIQ